MANTPPWVRFFSDPTPDIGSTPTLILLKQNAAIIRAIYAVNKTSQEIFVTVTALQERLINNVETPITTYRYINFPVKPYQSIDLIQGMAPLLEGGDSLFANSDFSDNRFDCCVDGEELLEPQV